MSAPRIAFLVAALVLTAWVDLFAQQVPTVVPGDRVRVKAPTIDRRPLVGSLVSLDADTCALRVEGHAGPSALPLASLETLEVFRGKKSRARTGFIVGLLVGAAGGAAIGIGFSEVLEGDWGPGDAMLGALVFAPVTGCVGALIGWLVKVDRWEVVDLDSVRVGLRPHGEDGLAVSVSVAF